jgi:hypothetical protein
VRLELDGAGDVLLTNVAVNDMLTVHIRQVLRNFHIAVIVLHSRIFIQI